jgi:hypothetical protein
MSRNSLLTTLFITCLAAVPCTMARAQQCPRFVDQADYGPAEVVAVVGTTAVAGFGQVLVVIDVSTPASPAAIGEVDLGEIIDGVAISGTTALATLGSSGGEGVAIVDISTPSSPSFIGVQTTDLPPEILDIAVDGATVYLATGSTGTKAYTLTGVPSLIPYAEYGTPYTRWVEVDPSTGLVYANSFQAAIIDFSDPTDVTVVATLTGGSSGFDGPFVFLGSLAVGSLGGDGASVWDVSTPSVPNYQTTISWPTSRLVSRKLGAVPPDLLFMSEASRGLYAYDLSDPSNPQMLDDSREVGFASGLSAVGDRMLIAASDSGILEIRMDAVLNDIEIVGSIALGSSANSLAMEGSTVYSLSTALWVYEASSATGLSPLGHARSRGWHADLAVDGNYAIASQLFRDTVHVFDVSDSQNPVWRSSNSSAGGDGGAALADGRGAIAEWDGGITEFNVDSPGYANPPYILADVYEAAEVAFVPGTQLAIVAGKPSFPVGSGLHLFVFERPEVGSTYNELGRAEVVGPWECTEIVTSGTMAYAACEDEIIALEFSDPSNPVASIAIDAWSHSLSFADIAMANGFLVVATDDQGVWVFDATNHPLTPVAVGSFALDERVTAVAADAGPLFVAGFDHRSPMLFSLDQCEFHSTEIFSDGFESGDTSRWD